MKRLVLVACCMIPLTAVAAVSKDGAASVDKSVNNLTAAQIVDRNVAARGGLQAWRAVKTMAMSGEMEAGGTKNTELPFTMRMKRPHKSRLEIQFRDRTAVQVYDGTQGWKVRPFLGRDDAEPFTPTEIKEAAAWEELDGPLVDYASKGTKVELQGTESVEGHKTYKLLLTMKDGEQRHVWIDATSFLELKIDGQQRRLDGKTRHVAIYYRDYQTDNGLTVPHVFETVVDGAKMPHKMQIDRVTFNQPMDHALFEKPQQTAAASSTR